MADPYIGEIRIFAGTFAPRGWALCNGQLIQVAQNPALFSIIGTIYGGNGRTDFALPDLRGRSPCHEGRGPGLSNHPLGQRFGAETVTLNAQQIPAHAHGLVGSGGPADSPDPHVGLPAVGLDPGYRRDPDATMSGASLANAGGGQPHANRPPSLVVNYIIALEGVFPQRS